MKTTTEYQSLIFSAMAERGEERTLKRQQLRWNVVAAIAYGMAGFCVMLGIGSSPLDWEFWVVFGPLFVASEIAIGQLLRSRN